MSNTTYKIFPSIGVMRVGNSSEFYLAPEKPGGLPSNLDGSPFTVESFRDKKAKMKRQGVRFRIFKYEAGQKPKEVKVGADDIVSISWTCHVANKKSSWYAFMTRNGEQGYGPNHPLRNAGITDKGEREKLIIDPGPRSLSKPNQQAHFDKNGAPAGYPVNFPPPLKPHSIETLGHMQTDDQGNLIVVGGLGHSGSRYEPVITEYANNDGWWDDTSDGPVTAEVTLTSGEKVAVAPAWVMAGPPAYAPEILNIVTLYDTIFDTSVRNLAYRPDIYADQMWNKDYKPIWQRDIKPLLDRVEDQQWVAAIPPKPHSFDWEALGNPDPKYNAVRGYYLSKLRAPNQQNQLKSKSDGYTLMPYLAGDDATGASQQASKFLTVTQTQYFMLMQWADGNFEHPADDKVPAHDEGDQLTFAMLENCVGGAFSPGIEMTWISRNPLIYSEAFRIKLKANIPTPLSLSSDLDEGLEPGDACKYMACPWQADFNECSSQPIDDRFVWWWPAQRPEFVYVKADPKDPNTDENGLIEVPWIGIGYDQTADNFIAFPNDLEMVEKWQDLGFVFNVGTSKEPSFVEVARNLPPQYEPPIGD